MEGPKSAFGSSRFVFKASYCGEEVDCGEFGAGIVFEMGDVR